MCQFWDDEGGGGRGQGAEFFFFRFQTQSEINKFGSFRNLLVGVSSLRRGRGQGGGN